MGEVRSVSDYLTRYYGFETYEVENPIVDELGVSALQFAKANPNRVSLWICNLSANAMYIGPFRDVSSTKGFYLAPNGGIHVFQVNDDFNIPTRDWWGIAGGAASDILTLELRILL